MSLERSLAKNKRSPRHCFANDGAGHKELLARLQLRSDQETITSISSRLNLYHVDTANCVQAIVSKDYK